MVTRMLALLASIAFALPLQLQASALSAVRSAPWEDTCDTPNHHQLDFWIGKWSLSRVQPDGTEEPGEHNIVEKAFDGCAIRENYSAPGNFTGGSITAYDRGHGEWRQLYADASGAVVTFHGNWMGDHMELTAKLVGKQGSPFTMRLTLKPRSDGSVRLTYETSRDEITWKPNTDLIYRRERP